MDCVIEFDINNFVLVSNIYQRNGNKLTAKFNNIGKRTIPGLITNNNNADTYKVKILVNTKDLIINNVYDINYKLLKKTNKDIIDNIIKEYDVNNKSFINENISLEKNINNSNIDSFDKNTGKININSNTKLNNEATLDEYLHKDNIIQSPEFDNSDNEFEELLKKDNII